MKSFKWALVALSVMSVVSCGGGGSNAGTSPFDATSACAVAAASAASPACSAASTLTLQLSSSSILNNGAATITATATASTDSGQALAGIPVLFSVDNGATFTQTSSTTTANGQATATISIGADPSNRVITVKARSGTLTSSAPFAVTGATVTATGSGIVVPGSTGNQVNFRLTNANGLAIPSQAITIDAGALGTAVGTTGTNGDFIYTYTAPAAAGSLDITGTSGGVSKTLTVLVQSGAGSIAPATGTIVSASVSANPSVVSTNTATTNGNNRTEIRALFVGAGNAPVARVRVRFDTNGDPNSIGGTFSTGSSVIYSDANGIATTAFIPGDRASPTNGVTIRACYDNADFTGCAKSTTATITVASDPLAVTIGSNAEIIVGSSGLTYKRQFVVLVVDASGRAKANVDIIPSIDLDYFFKGFYSRVGSKWAQSSFVCLAEDLNRNGVLEAGEDINGNGSLEPRKSDVAVSILGSGKTDSAGSAIVQIEYPQNVASWARVKILVAATGISGTEGRATWIEVLPVLAAALDAESPPAFVRSPYGVVISPTTPSPCNNAN